MYNSIGIYTKIRHTQLAVEYISFTCYLL